MLPRVSDVKVTLIERFIPRLLTSPRRADVVWDTAVHETRNRYTPPVSRTAKGGRLHHPKPATRLLGLVIHRQGQHTRAR